MAVLHEESKLLGITLALLTMTWRCTGKSNQELIHNMLTSNIIQSERVSAVLLLYLSSLLNDLMYLPGNGQGR